MHEHETVSGHFASRAAQTTLETLTRDEQKTFRGDQSVLQQGDKDQNVLVN